VDELRWLILAAAGIGILAWIAWSRVYWRYAWAAVAPISWLLHVAAFHAARLAGAPLSAVTLNQWSIAIHLHALILLVGAPLIYRRMSMPYD